MEENGDISHESALSSLQEYVEIGAKPIDFLAQATALYLKITKLKLISLPDLQQKVLGLSSKEEKFGSEFSFLLVHANGTRRISLRTELEEESVLVVDDLNASDNTVIRNRFSTRLDVHDDAATMLTAQRIRDLIKNDFNN